MKIFRWWGRGKCFPIVYTSLQNVCSVFNPLGLFSFKIHKAMHHFTPVELPGEFTKNTIHVIRLHWIDSFIAYIMYALYEHLFSYYSHSVVVLFHFKIASFSLFVCVWICMHVCICVCVCVSCIKMAVAPDSRVLSYSVYKWSSYSSTYLPEWVTHIQHWRWDSIYALKCTYTV